MGAPNKDQEPGIPCGLSQAPKVDLLNKEHKLLGEPENPEVDAAADAYKLQRSLLAGLQQEVTNRSLLDSWPQACTCSLLKPALQVAVERSASWRHALALWGRWFCDSSDPCVSMACWVGMCR